MALGACGGCGEMPVEASRPAGGAAACAHLGVGGGREPEVSRAVRALTDLRGGGGDGRVCGRQPAFLGARGAITIGGGGATWGGTGGGLAGGSMPRARWEGGGDRNPAECAPGAL